MEIRRVCTRERFLFICVWIFIFRCVPGYNIETKKIGLLTGTPRSQFGYSVAFANEPGWKGKTSETINKVLLVGAPNTTDENIKGYGDVIKCENPNTKTMTCSSLHIRQISNGKSMCDSIRKTSNKSHCEEDQRLGATIAVNRNFENVMWSTSTVPMVTVCAPGWKNTYTEYTPKYYQKYMIGVCLKLREDLQVMDCFPGSDGTKEINDDNRGYCWPFWPTGQTGFHAGRPVYSYAESGFAMDFTKDGLEEVIAAPGIEDWRGGFTSHKGRYTKKVSRKDHPTTQYYGYSLVTGRFKILTDDNKHSNILAGVPNFFDRNNGNLGKVEILANATKMDLVIFGKVRKCTGIKVMNPNKFIKEKQVGSKFGASVAAIDITGDGFDEVFVGAPQYSGEQTEEGRVFVYTTDDSSVCGPIGILSGSSTIKQFKTQANYARFGTSIASAGDLNDDGYKDIAIGAPYEDSGRGAVYIYHGLGQCNCRMKDNYAQRILGGDLDPGLRTFGWQIFGEDDVDHNEYPDLAVGAYASDQAVVLRTRPIASVFVQMHIQPNPIPLNGSTLACSVDKARLCFEVIVVFLVGGKGLADNIALEFELSADTVYKQKEGDSRLLIRGTDNSTILDELTVMKSQGKQLSKTYILDVKNRSNTVEPNDIWTVVRVEGNFRLVNSSDSDFEVLDPVLKEDLKNHVAEDVRFAINCDNLEDCTSDLKLTVELYFESGGRRGQKVEKDTILYLGASENLQMQVDVTNLQSSSYGSKFTSLSDVALEGDITLSDSRRGAVDATCRHLTEKSTSTLNCTADSKLDKGQNFKVKAGFDISRARLMAEDNIDNLQPFIEINVTAGQVNNDVNPTNNNVTIKLPVQLKYKIEVTVDTEISDRVRYKADEKSTRVLPVIHRYYITNEGPSMLPKTYVNITVPVALKDIIYAEIKEVTSGCTIAGKGSLVETTTTPKSTEVPTTRFTIQTPKPQRRRRAVEDQVSSGNETEIPNDGATTDKNLNTVFIKCDDGYKCETVICPVTNLEKGDERVVNVTVEVKESSLAKAKAKGNIHYITRAEVTDPFVWHGGKVVPWDKTPFGEKSTTFVVEPASVPHEVNIWIIIGSILGALLLLIIVVVVLWKVGFFKRKKHGKVKKWKQESLYKRRSRASSTKSQTPYNPMDKPE